jgi:uroporphyrinogen-III decarboxylase
MTSKERFINTLTFKEVDRIPVMEIAAWVQTVERWHGEGLSKKVNPQKLFGGNEYFQLEGVEGPHIDCTTPYPPYDKEILAENDRNIKFIDEMGRTRQALKTGELNGSRLSMDQYIDFPVKDFPSYREYRKRFEGNYDARYPANWEEVKKYAAATDRPYRLTAPHSSTFGFYSMLRNWMGTERLAYMLYDNPELINECLDFLTDFIIHLLKGAVRDIKFDFCYIHEDMCFKNGPLISPHMFKEFFAPRYKKYTQFLRDNGVNLIIVDTDGNFEDLIPLFLECGVDGFGPIEIASGLDPMKIRQRYG